MSAARKLNQDVLTRVWEIVNALPQRAAIAESDARLWVEEVISAHGEAAIWHAIRLNGFGGSEIGVLARNHAGQRADHQASAHDIVEGKLMRRAPLESTAHLRRGHENEEPHSLRFWAKYGAVRDQASFDALKNAQGQRQWMRYSPDDLVLMPLMLVQDDDGVFTARMTPGQMHRWLIDYKAPSKVEEGDEIAFQYACQLSQGAILCAENGVDLDGMMLSQFDWANWALKDDVITWDENLGRMVIEAGDHYWDYVLKGQVPGYIRKQEMPGTEEFAREHLTAAQMYASLAALASASDKRASEIKSLLVEPISGKRMGDQKISFGVGRPVLTLAAKQMMDREAVKKAFTASDLLACSSKTAVYDADAMAAYLRANDVDLKQFRKYDLDATKVYARAAEIGLDPDILVGEQLTLSPDKLLKEQMTAYIDQHYPLDQARRTPGDAQDTLGNDFADQASAAEQQEPPAD